MSKQRKIFMYKFERSCKTFTDKTAIKYLLDSGKIVKCSYSKFYDAVQTRAEILKGIFNKGDRIVLLANLSPYCYMTYMAAVFAGLTTVVIDSQLPTAEIDCMIEKADVRGIVADDQSYNDYAIKYILKMPVINIYSMKIHGHQKYIIPKTTDPNPDAAAILFSSGTTSTNKGVVISYHGQANSTGHMYKAFGTNKLSFLTVLPFFHISGFTVALSLLMVGAEMDMVENFNTNKIQNALQVLKPNTFGMVPKVFEIIQEKIENSIKEKNAEKIIFPLMKLNGFLRKNFGINIGRYIFRSINKQAFGGNLKTIALGGSLVKPEMAEFYLNLGYTWINNYASTEANMPIVTTTHDDKYPVFGRVDYFDDIKIKIISPDSTGTGEIAVKSDTLMIGYFRDEQATKNAFDEYGFFKTGDLGYIEDNRIHITGRIKESIHLSNGEKVSASAIDDYYFSRLGCAEVVSRGVLSSDGTFDEVHIWVEVEEDSEKSAIEKKLLNISRKAPANFKIQKVHFINKIPRTAIGKAKRFLLKENSDEEITKKPVSEQSVQIADTSDIENTVKIKIRQIASLDEDFEILEQHNIQKDIGMDSLGIFELCSELDSIYSVSLEPYVNNKLTVGRIIQLVQNGTPNTGKNIDDTRNFPIKRTKKDNQMFKTFIALSRLLYNTKLFGTENVKSGERYIFCPNHECHFDGMWVMGNLPDEFRNNFCSVAADYLFKDKSFRKGVVLMGGIPVHRSGNTTTAMKRACECITNEGYNLLIHPEGTRTRDGKLGKFKSGAADLAIKSGLKIIPVCINGARDIFPPDIEKPRIFDKEHFRRYPLEIHYGKPIDPNGKSVEQITGEIEKQIRKCKAKYNKNK